MSFNEAHRLEDFNDNNEDGMIENRYSNSSDSDDVTFSSKDHIGINNASQYGNSGPVSTIDSDVSDEQLKETEINWSKLPSLAVENIYSFLSRTDQTRMSQVCSRWAKDFGSPKIWKTIKFYLPEQDYSSEIYPEVRFARMYAPMFRHVEIICETVKLRLIGVICSQLKLFLEAMATSTQLTSIKFISMGKYFRRLDDTLHEDLMQSIARFFHSQENLQTVVFQDSRFDKEKGSELLKAVCHSKNTIRNLTLRDFVREDPDTVLSRYSANLEEVCVRIASVQSLEVDYTQTFEDIINCLSAKLSSGDCHLDEKKFSLSTLSIYCKKNIDTPFGGISSGTWKLLKKVFPGLKVKMDVTIRGVLSSEMEMFLVKEIPLQSLDFRNEKFSTPARIDISALFTHLRICKYENSLETLNVYWLPSRVDLVGSVIPFVQSCEKLQNFHLHVSYMPSGIENILGALLENHPQSLSSITLWFDSLIANGTVTDLSALSEEFYPLFNAQGIKCFLIADPSRSLRSQSRNAIAP